MPTISVDSKAVSLRKLEDQVTFAVSLSWYLRSQHDINARDRIYVAWLLEDAFQDMQQATSSCRVGYI